MVPALAITLFSFPVLRRLTIYSFRTYLTAGGFESTFHRQTLCICEKSHFHITQPVFSLGSRLQHIASARPSLLTGSIMKVTKRMSLYFVFVVSLPLEGSDGFKKKNCYIIYLCSLSFIFSRGQCIILKCSSRVPVRSWAQVTFNVEPPVLNLFARVNVKMLHEH